MTRRWTDQQLSAVVSELTAEYATRDARIALRKALLYRRYDEATEAQAGTFVPKPLHESKLVIRHMSGLLTEAAQHLAPRISENQPRIQVERVTSQKGDVLARLDRDAAKQENAMNGVWYYAGGRDGQGITAWRQVVEGAGWLCSYERAASFGLPERRYFEQNELSDEELEKLRIKGDVTPVEIAHPDGRLLFAESADLWERRRLEEANKQALSGSSMVIMEFLSNSQVYVRNDKLGVSLGIIIEEIPRSDLSPGSEIVTKAAQLWGDTNVLSAGLMVNAKGHIVSGMERGAGERELSGVKGRIYLIRVWTRDELYYMVASESAKSGGRVVFFTEHDYGEVPLWAAPFTRTGEHRHEEEFLPALDAAFAVIPGFNQAATLLSTQAGWNSVPRYVLEMPPDKDGSSGGLYTDPQTGQLKVLSGDGTVGLDPAEMEKLPPGAKVTQIRIDDGGTVQKVLEFYYGQLKDVTPSDAATGAAGATGPAWTTRLLQRAQSVKIQPGVEGHVRMVQGWATWYARLVRRRAMPVVILAAPGKRGEERTTRYLIELDPESVTTNISVHQDPNTQDDRITLQQVGLDLRDRLVIDDWQLYEEYMGESDPADAIKRKYKQIAKDYIIFGSAEQAPPGSLLATVVEMVMGRLPALIAERSPAAAEAMALASMQKAEPPIEEVSMMQAGGASVANTAGIKQPGVGMSLTQPQLQGQPGGGGTGIMAPVSG